MQKTFTAIDFRDIAPLRCSMVSSVLTVETALALVKDVYEYGHSIQVRNLTVKDNQIAELKQRVDDLLALNHTVIKESNDGDS